MLGRNYNTDSTFINSNETELAITSLNETIDFLNEQYGEETEAIDNNYIINQGVFHFSNNVTIFENSTITLSGTNEDIIILNFDRDLVIETGVTLILDGISPANVYWNIGRSLTIDESSEIYGIFLVSNNAQIKQNVLGKISILALNDVEIENGVGYYSRTLFDSENTSADNCPNCIGTNLVEHGEFPYGTAGISPGTNNFFSTFIFNPLTSTHQHNPIGIYTLGNSTLDYSVGIWGSVTEHTGNNGNFMMVDGAYSGTTSPSKTVWQQYISDVSSASLYRFSAYFVSLYQSAKPENVTKLEFVVNDVVIKTVTLPYNQNWYNYCVN